jgi:hypothetical protein
VDVLAGTPFLVTNDIAIRSAKRQVIIQGTEVVRYGSQPKSSPSVRRTQAFLVRPERQMVILPGEFVELATPKESDPDCIWALEPRLDSNLNKGVKLSQAWPPAQEISSIGHTLRVLNDANEPIFLKKHDHVCQVRAISPSDDQSTSVPSSHQRTSLPSAPQIKPYSESVSLDPDSMLTHSMRRQFQDVNRQYDEVFNPSIAKYNGASGKIEATVNMGPVLPPQRKGHLPHYN